MNKANLILKLYSITVTGVLALVLFTGFRSTSSIQKFEEIFVERINIIEPDGKLKMVISNQKRQHPGMMDGSVYPARERPPGILFFNEEQDEVGGLAFYGNKAEGGNHLFLSFDQYKDDQIMQLMEYTRENGDNRYGLQLWEIEKPLKMKDRMVLMDSLDKEGYNYRRKLEYLRLKNGGVPAMAPRMFAGRNYDGETGLFLQDKFGVDRLRLYIDTNNLPKLEVLNAKGEVVREMIKN